MKPEDKLNGMPDWEELQKKLKDPALTGGFADDEEGRQLKAAMEKLLTELNSLTANARKLAEKSLGDADE